MHSQCTAPNHVYKDIDTGQVASDLVSCIEPQSLPDSLESPCFHCVFPYALNRVTAAYTTITYRLGVVVTRLLAAAFWLGVGE
jgi:hypothetical protein